MSPLPTSLADELDRFTVSQSVEGVEAGVVVAPGSVDDLAVIVALAAEHGASLVPVGSGSTLNGESADIAVSTANMAGVIDYQPDDLTIVVGAGTSLGDLDSELADRHHTAVLPETAPDRTVGGVVASGASGYRRLKYGPTRDRVLEVTMATGYGEVVRAGGRLVKNVTGYDIPRLATGSFGSLGIIGSVCLKLWPEPAHRLTVAVDDPTEALISTYKPVAVLQTSDGVWAYLEGDGSTVTDQARALGGEAVEGFQWPEPRSSAVTVSMRIPPRYVEAAVHTMPAAEWFVAQHGVGVIEMGTDSIEHVDRMRDWAESVGGSVVVEAPGLTSLQRWGNPPTTIEIQRRMKSLFDPAGVCHPGALPGGL